MCAGKGTMAFISNLTSMFPLLIPPLLVPTYYFVSLFHKKKKKVKCTRRILQWRDAITPHYDIACKASTELWAGVSKYYTWLFQNAIAEWGNIARKHTRTHMYTHTEKDATNQNNLIKTKSCPSEKTLLEELASTEFTG